VDVGGRKSEREIDTKSESARAKVAGVENSALMCLKGEL
jgi:hypothetical protein